MPLTVCGSDVSTGRMQTPTSTGSAPAPVEEGAAGQLEMAQPLLMHGKATMNFLQATKWIAVWAAAMIGLTVTALAQSTAAPTNAYKIEETRWGPWDQNWLDPAFSRDWQHFAYWTATNGGKKQFVVVDAQAGP